MNTTTTTTAIAVRQNAISQHPMCVQQVMQSNMTDRAKMKRIILMETVGQIWFDAASIALYDICKAYPTTSNKITYAMWWSKRNRKYTAADTMNTLNDMLMQINNTKKARG